MGDYKEKLAKLKELAESERELGNIAAAENFSALLQKLLAQHKLSLSEIEIAEDKIGQGWLDFEKFGIAKTSRRSAWKETLAGFVAKAYGCQILVVPKSNKLGIIGFESNREIAEYTICLLIREADKIADQEYIRVYQRDRHEAAGFKKSFLAGFIERIAQRLKDEMKRSEEGTGTSLMVLNNDYAKVKDWMAQQGNFRSSTAIGQSSKEFNANAYDKGQKFADGMDIHGKAVNGGSDNKKLN